MNFLAKLFGCQDNDDIPLPRLKHKTVSEPLSNNDFQEEMWIRKTEHIHCEFDYKLGELLGQGAGGKVYLAEVYRPDDKKLIGKVALKILSKSKMLHQRNYKKYLILEKRVQAQVKSKFVIKFIESFQSKINCFIACEYASGGTLATFLHHKRRRQMEHNLEECVRFIAACVFLGLKSIHNSNFVYRDLKPQNILIVQNGYVKISDFGLSEEVLDGGMIYGCKAGTLPYLAPEMSLRTGHNKLVDLWSYGVLIYELFTKSTPFTEMEINSKLFLAIAENAQKNHRFIHPLISDEAEDLISQLLKANKQERIGANNLDDIKNHGFFKNFDWESLQSQSMQSPLQKIMNQNPKVEVRSRRCSSTDDEQNRYSCKNVSQFTTQGSPVRKRRL